jgi:hypothetical protein
MARLIERNGASHRPYNLNAADCNERKTYSDSWAGRWRVAAQAGRWRVAAQAGRWRVAAQAGRWRAVDLVYPTDGGGVVSCGRYICLLGASGFVNTKDVR